MYNKVLLKYVIFLLTGLEVFAGENQWIQKTIDLTINNKFNEALEIVEERIKAYPDDYRAHFYIAATLNSKMTHFENEDDYERFNSAIDTTLVLVQRRLNSGKQLPDSLQAELLFYEGSAYGYRAYFQGRIGKWLAALSNGIKSVGNLSESLEIDSTIYGAYLGIGVYKYWRYSRLRFISWLPFIPDDRDEGIALIKQAIDHDTLSRFIAMHQLVYILLDYEKMDEAILYAEKIVSKYPESQFMWWANAHAYFKSGNYAKAESAYLTLNNLIEKDENRNFAHLLKCGLKLALIYKELGNFKKCKARCESILDLSKDFELSESELDILSQIKELMEDCRDYQKE